MFHDSAPPTSIDSLQPEDEYFLRRLLPRLNTHHKQFFFAKRPIFVEGYTDQQLFTLIQDKRSKLMGATGACFIDVNGKDEQDFFYRLCRHLQIDAQFIADLDLLTRGSFRTSISGDPRCQAHAATQGVGPNLMDAIRDLNNRLDTLIREFIPVSPSPLPDLLNLIQTSTETESKRYAMLLALIHQKPTLSTALPTKTNEIAYVMAKLTSIRLASEEAGVFILSKGALENHVPSYLGSAYVIPDKAKAATFEQERDILLADTDPTIIEARYPELIPLLDRACGDCHVDVKLHLSYAIGVLIGNIQMAFQRQEIDSLDSLKRHALVDWNTFERIIEGMSFETIDRSFKCRMKLKSIIDKAETQFEFHDDTVHSKFAL